MFTASNGGWEYPAFLAAATIAQALLGSGAFALDVRPVSTPERSSRYRTSSVGILPSDADRGFVARTWTTYRRMTSPGISPDVTFKSIVVGLAAGTRQYDAHFAFLRWDRKIKFAGELDVPPQLDPGLVWQFPQLIVPALQIRRRGRLIRSRW